MTQPAKSQEPSMEEILASIRRIIADDDASKAGPKAAEPAKGAPRPPPPRPAQPEPKAPEIRAQAPVEPPAAAGFSVQDQASDILDLTESMATPPFAQPAPAPQFRKIEGYSDVSFDEAEEQPAVPPNGDGSAAAGGPSDGERGRLLSAATNAAVDSAFHTLAQTVLVQNARTLEDLVREMLRPMLKTWLDDNLPGMVERLVRAEIERVARGR